MAAHNELGKWGEQLAADFLERQGMRILERDWHDNHRDIDIIAVDGDDIVFVEVKTRSNNSFLEPEFAVNRAKIKNLMFASNRYVKMKRIDLRPRFDIVAIVGSSVDDCTMRHIKEAFLPIPIYR